MIEKCANRNADWLINWVGVKDTDKELNSYAVYSILLSLSPLLLAIGFGIGMGCVGRSVMIIIPFEIIRKLSGGNHTNNAWSSLVRSCLLLVLCMVLSFHIKCGWVLALITVGAAVSLICFSPIDNENRVLSQEECGCYKMITTVLVIIFMLVDALLFVCQLHIYSICISIGIMLSAGLQLPYIFKELRKMLTN